MIKTTAIRPRSPATPISTATVSGAAHIEQFAKHESRVRSYARNFPALFTRAEGTRIFDQNGNSYLDFLSGAGSLNYGHNHPVLRDALIAYIRNHGIAHSLDLHTTAKANFLDKLNTLILQPRKLDYVAQFTGPTGANSVEAALKIARTYTGRRSIVTFTNGFHGVTLGALAMTGNAHHRGGAGVELNGATRMPYDGYLGAGVDTLEYFEKTLNDHSSGIDLPAAVIVETLQGEGGLNVASNEWLQRLQALCRRNKILLIVDDIQAGCGRTGHFFSFETAGLQPDIVTLSKSLSGMGLPFAITLLRRELDIWKPGEHNGTFRGNNHAFVTAAAALEHFWSDDAFAGDVRRKADIVTTRLAALADEFQGELTVKGRGLMQGLSFANAELAGAVSREAYRRKLIIETGGPNDEVLKCLCPLTIEDGELNQALDIVRDSTRHVFAAAAHTASRLHSAQGE
jgi:diaminobutyrate-2-oxoglutarate transaminase